MLKIAFSDKRFKLDFVDDAKRRVFGHAVGYGKGVFDGNAAHHLAEFFIAQFGDDNLADTFVGKDKRFGYRFVVHRTAKQHDVVVAHLFQYLRRLFGRVVFEDLRHSVKIPSFVKGL